MNEKNQDITLLEYGEYAVGGMFKLNFGAYVVNTYWLFFLTNVIGLPTALAATTNTITKFMKIFSMTLAGTIVDSTNFKMGRYRAWILIGDIGLFIFTGLLFVNFEASPMTYVIIILLVQFFHMTAYNVTWTSCRALVGVMATTTTESVGLTSAANIGSKLAGTFSGLVYAPLFALLAASNQPYMLTSYVFALSFPICSLILLHVSKKYEVEETSANVAKKPKPEKVPLADMLACLKGPGLWFCISNTFMNSNGVQQVLLVYYTTYVLKNPAVTGYVTSASSFAGIFAALLSPWLCAKLSKKGVYIFSTVCGALCYTAYYFIGSSATLFIALRVLQTFITTPVGTAVVAMANDIADYNEMQGRKSAKAFAQAMMGVTIRVGSLIGTALGSYCLVWIGYEKGTTPTEPMLKSIVFMMSIIPALCYALAALTILFYKIDDKEIEAYRIAKRDAKLKNS